jgi:hypothetical protein
LLLLRARLFQTVRQRLPLLVAGLVGLLAPVFVAGTGSARQAVVVLAGLVVAAVAAAVAGLTYSRRAPSPYLTRAASVLDGLLIVSALPIACAVFGLYSQARALVG